MLQFYSFIHGQAGTVLMKMANTAASTVNSTARCSGRKRKLSSKLADSFLMQELPTNPTEAEDMTTVKTCSKRVKKANRTMLGSSIIVSNLDLRKKDMLKSNYGQIQINSKESDEEKKQEDNQTCIQDDRSAIPYKFKKAYNELIDLCENTFKKMKVCAVCGQTAYYNPNLQSFALSLEKLEIPLSQNWAGQVSLHAEDKLEQNRKKSYYVCSSCYCAKDTDFAYAKMHRTHFEERYLKLYYACLDPKQVDPKYRHYLGFLDITFDFLQRCSGNELSTKVHCLFEMPLISNSIDQKIEHFKCPDLIWKLYQTNLVHNPLYKKYCSLLERPNYQNITIVPPQIIENIVSKAARRDPRPHLTAEDGEPTQLMSDGQMSSVIRTNRNSPYGLTSDQQLQAGFLYAKPRGVAQEPKQISLVCNIQETDTSTNRDISVEAALFPYLFPKGTGFYQGTQSFSKYLKFRFRQLFSPHTLTQEFICVMFQIYTTLLYATDNLRYIIQRDWTKYWTFHPTATEEEAIQEIVKHKLPKTTPYSPLWYKNKLYDVQAMTAKHGALDAACLLYIFVWLRVSIL